MLHSVSSTVMHKQLQQDAAKQCPLSPPLTVCASISASLSGLLPLLTAWRSRRSVWMKSLALITPTTAPHALSYSGADAMPCAHM